MNGQELENRAMEHYRKLEAMYRAAPINSFFQPELRVSEGCADLTIPVREDFFHTAGAMHGSVYFKALDDAAYFAVSSLVEDVFVLTVSFTVYLLRPVNGGTLTAQGRVVSRSKNLFVAESVLYVDGDRQVARGSGTFSPGKVPLADVPEYA